LSPCAESAIVSKNPSIWRSRLLWRLFAINAVTVVLFLAVAGTYQEFKLKADLLEEVTRDLEMRSRLVQDGIRHGGGELQAEVRRLAEVSGARVTVIAPGGRVRADSEASASAMDNHAARPEVQAALSRGVGSAIRYSNTRRVDYLYVAVAGGEGEDIVRLAIDLRQVNSRLRVAEHTILVTVAALFAAGVLLSLIVVRFIVRPVGIMRRAAQRIAEGNLDTRIELSRRDEFGDLVTAFNTMSGELRRRVGEIEAKRRELTAIMDNMSEALLLLNEQGEIMVANRTATRILASEGELVGRNLWEVVRLPEVDELLASLPDLSEPRRVWIEDLTHSQRRVLAFVATPLFETGSGERHAVLLISDATEDQKLLEMRQDFVANVSHELKTPLTSISAYVETLLKGAQEDASVRQPFLEKIQSNAMRLSNLVSDILNLSRLESGIDDESRRHLDLNEVIDQCVRKHAEDAQRKGLKLTMHRADKPARALLNEEDMTEAVDNLIVNAINYTPEGGSVDVRVQHGEQGLIVEVRDTGSGIPPDALPRIFERFYRVDKARSRHLGGTGLGLAIVKHAAIKHGGRVEAESEVGKGSTFRILLPAASQRGTA
jgi:two-component system, OmpR family, phosphate regulon sensor histidine kinase PhoR